jgi:hypothetical protein
MSAFRLHSINKGSAFSFTCDEPGCNKKGRYRIEIAGRPVLSERSLTTQQAQLCQACGRKAKLLWAELSGETLEAEAVAAIEGLARPSKCTDAVWALRELGFPGPLVAEAVTHAQQGWSVERIRDGLEREVAAA